MEELRLTNDAGWRVDYSVGDAVRSMVTRADDVEDRIDAVARLLAAMLEKQPEQEILRVLNASDWRYSWRKLEDSQ